MMKEAKEEKVGSQIRPQRFSPREAGRIKSKQRNVKIRVKKYINKKSMK